MHRLWHQLSNKLLEFFDHPLTKPYRFDVFNKFVRDFETKLNQLRLVEMGVKVSREIDSEWLFHLVPRVEDGSMQNVWSPSGVLNICSLLACPSMHLSIHEEAVGF